MKYLDSFLNTRFGRYISLILPASILIGGCIGPKYHRGIRVYLNGDSLPDTAWVEISKPNSLSHQKSRIKVAFRNRNWSFSDPEEPADFDGFCDGIRGTVSGKPGAQNIEFAQEIDQKFESYLLVNDGKGGFMEIRPVK
jgi:hypothetical protein